MKSYFEVGSNKSFLFINTNISASMVFTAEPAYFVSAKIYPIVERLNAVFLALRRVKYNYYSICISHMQNAKRSIFLLSSGVPKVDFHDLAIFGLEVSPAEVNTDGN